MLYHVESAAYQSLLSKRPLPVEKRAPAANEVLSAHSTIATLVTTEGGVAVFGVKHYLRYAQLSTTRGDPPQVEWRITIGQAEAQTARFVEEAEGSITAVIRSLKQGALVALDWVQVGMGERVEHPCQKLEGISSAKEEKLLAAHPEVSCVTTARAPMHPARVPIQ